MMSAVFLEAKPTLHVAITTCTMMMYVQCRSRKLYNFVTKIDRLGTSFVVVVVKPPVSAMHCSRTHVHGMNKTFARVGAILHSL